MCDTEIRRVMRVVLTAVDQVRELYRESSGGGEDTKGGGRQSGAGGAGIRAELERAGKVLWETQGVLVLDEADRYGKELKGNAEAMRKSARVMARAGHRDAADALVDAADAVEAVVEIMRLGVEAGLAG